MRSTWPYITLLSISPKKLKEVRDGCSSFRNAKPSLIIIAVTTNTSSAHAMIDTGATHTSITRSLLETLLHLPTQTTYTTTVILGDVHTTISLYGMVLLCIYINHIPTHASVFVIESLGADLILGMDWCRTYNIILRILDQELLLHHLQCGQTTVHFQDTISISIRLAQSIQLASYHEHLVPLSTPLSSANQFSYTSHTNLCKQTNIFIPDAILCVDVFELYFYL